MITARSQFHLSLLETVYISRKKTTTALCRQKQFIIKVKICLDIHVRGLLAKDPRRWTIFVIFRKKILMTFRTVVKPLERIAKLLDKIKLAFVSNFLTITFVELL